MDEEEIIKRLLELVDHLKLEIELLTAKVSEIDPLNVKIIEFEAKPAQYENAHTPPSLRRGRNRKKDQDKNDKGKPDQKIGHKGVTRPHATSDR